MATIPDAFNLALQHHRAGRLQQAEAIYRQILESHPSHPDALHLLGVIAHQVGQHDLAIRYIKQAIAQNPVDAKFHNNIGGAYRAQGKWEEAETHYRQALALKPAYAEAFNNLGITLKAQGKLEEAVVHYRQALAHMPDYAEAYNNLGNALKEQGRLDEAVVQYQQALALKPTFAEAHNNLGAAQQEQGRLEEAVAQCRQALVLKPAFAEAHNNLGLILSRQGHLEEAVAHYQKAIALKPDYAEAYNNLGNALKRHGRLEEAVAHYQKAIALKPDYGDAYNNLGSVLGAQCKLEEAVVHYKQAMAHAPNLAEAYINLGVALHELGQTEEALEYFRQAREIKDKDGWRILKASRLPVIANSLDHLLEARHRFKEQIAELLRQNLLLDDPVSEVVNASFYLAYQGCNDLEIQQSLSRLYEQACPSLNYTAAHCHAPCSGRAGRKIKVGFISAHFRNHTIGLLMRGLLAHLSRRMFSVTVLAFPYPADDVSESIFRHADRTVVLPAALAAARHQIAQEQLDILFYADIGMDPMTYFLAFSRLAPVQCVTWGHPVTTGIQAVDYFVSSELLEPKHAEEYYSERLVRLKHLPTYYYRPAVSTTPLVSRKEFGLDDRSTFYLCPQSLFKIHPDFDRVAANILQADQQGVIIFIEGNYSHWSELLRRRFQKTIPEVVDRIRFLPRQSSSNFQRLLSVADVILDPLHWSGGNTTYEALAVGTPIVTLPGEFMRGRVTYGCYTQMGVMDCVATTKEKYVKLAVRLGTDPSYRAKIKAKILAANNVLYENAEAVRDMERFFVEAVEAAQHATKKPA